MERIIIIDDKNCRKELADFLVANRKHIRFSTSVSDMNSSARGFFETLKENIGKGDKLAVNSKQNIEIIHTRDILYLEAAGNKTYLYLNNKSVIEAGDNLDTFLSRLKSTNFIMVHDHFIINLDYLTHFETGGSSAVLIDNSRKIPVDKAHQYLLLKYLNETDAEKMGK